MTPSMLHWQNSVLATDTKWPEKFKPLLSDTPRESLQIPGLEETSEK